MKFPRRRKRQAAAVATTKSPRKKRKKHVAEVGTSPKSTTQKRKKKRVAKAVSKLNRQVTKHEEQIKNIKAQKQKFQRRCKKLEELMEKNGSSDITSACSSTVTSPSQGTTVFHPDPVVVLERQVRSFLERDDNSRMNPGKQDCLTVDGEKVQTRILNDYLYILYEKFIAENPQVKKSKSSFYKLRPKHIRHSNCLKPNNCLC